MRAAAIAFLVALAPPLPAGATAGDAAHGAEIYQRCIACHALDRNRTGPKHCGLLGRRAGGVPDFPYSQAMRSSGIVWDAASLDRFLENPMKAVPGTRMGYAGVKDAKERADLIAYLKSATADPANCPP
jgi:cytochrome c